MVGFVSVTALVFGLCVLAFGSKPVDKEKIISSSNFTQNTNPTRSFTIDHDRNTFLKDGKPFRYVAGSFHYFRALPQAWRERLRTMRAAGVNVLDTCVEWSLHNPYDGVYNWEGIANIEQFIQIAKEEEFLVILRPGPYISAERDNGGLPYWLLKKYPDIKVRTVDKNYITEVSKWYAKLMPRLSSYFYGNGGPIIMAQVENEYAFFNVCDHEYRNWLRDEAQKYMQDKVLLFTVDKPDERMLCGKIEGVFATTEFGIELIHKIDENWATLRKIQPTGPLVNSEFYTGWLTHWQEKYQNRDKAIVANSLDKILSYGASVNIHMFFGGTNFGFTAGANNWGTGKYMADITSYDYDAPMDEAGGITSKYQLLREVIGKYLHLPDIKLAPAKRIAYGEVELNPILELFSDEGRAFLSEGKPVNAKQPKSFEELDQYSGLLLYETDLPKIEIDPTILRVQEVRDRAYVYVDHQFVGTLSREKSIFSLPLHKGWGKRLQLLVENQGRINLHTLNDTKGIFGTTTLQKLDGTEQALEDWTSTALPLSEKSIQNLLSKKLKDVSPQVAQQRILLNGPVVYHGVFHVPEIGDSFLNMSGWGKGIAYVNGINLGRYWPVAGPQLTLYVPNEALNIGDNTLVLFEFQRANVNDGRQIVEFIDVAHLDGGGINQFIDNFYSSIQIVK